MPFMSNQGMVYSQEHDTLLFIHFMPPVCNRTLPYSKICLVRNIDVDIRFQLALAMNFMFTLVYDQENI